MRVRAENIQYYHFFFFSSFYCLCSITSVLYMPGSDSLLTHQHDLTASKHTKTPSFYHPHVSSSHLSSRSPTLVLFLHEPSGMVIKATAVAAAATPATPSSSTVIISFTTRSSLNATTVVNHTIHNNTAGPPSSIARSPLWITSLWSGRQTPVRRYRSWPSYGVLTPGSKLQRLPGFEPSSHNISRSPDYCFETGYALCAKRPTRPLPPPFTSPPSSSFSEPLTTNYQGHYKGEPLRGLNNGDDAVLVAQNFLGVNDGVGAWATRERGHAA